MHSSRRREILRLQIIKTSRSLGQGALLVTFALYLDELGWTASEIGLLFSAGSLLGAALSVPIGILSDRIGRKQFVLINEIVIALAAAVAALSSSSIVLSVASMLGAFGRGQVGMVGPAGPAEQAWMAELTEPRERSRIYSVNSALGFMGTGAGALLAGLLPLWSGSVSVMLAYAPFFALVFVTSLLNVYLIAKTRTMQELRAEEGEHAAPSQASSAPRERGRATDTPAVDASDASDAKPALTPEEDLALRRQENALMLKLCGINALNGVAIGLTSPLMAYWFFLKFGTGPGALGPVFAITYFATAFASIATGRVSERIGIVRSVVSIRLLAVFLLVVMPIIPSFWLAAVVHTFRSSLSRGTGGARQALTVNLVRDERRGFASSMNSISSRLPNALGPMVAGFMLDAGQLALPFIVAAVMQFAYGVLFGKAFQAHDPNAVPAPARAAARS